MPATFFTLDGVDLPEDLVWTDEFGPWSKVEQMTNYSNGGLLYNRLKVKQAGRPITLEGDEKTAWATATELRAIQAKADAMDQMTLVTPDGRSFTVVFRYKDGPVEAKPVVDFTEVDGDDTYNNLKIRFFEV